MKAIGGYFELETYLGNEFHGKALKLNTGRNAFEYILKLKGYRKVYLPFYACDVLLEPLEKLKVEYEFYQIDNQLDPLFEKELNADEAFLYINYFGIKTETVKHISLTIQHLIIDNTQAFFSLPVKGIDTFYSARKFFGVADGAYLYTDKVLAAELDQDCSFGRMGHLLARTDKDAGYGYPIFKKNDEALNHQEIKLMSKLTEKILKGISYTDVSTIRRQNFEYLNLHLGKFNELQTELNDEDCPMIYPFLVPQGDRLRALLINEQIFVARYWESVIGLVAHDSFENKLVLNLLSLPVDQRYTISDMNRIVNIITKFYGI